MCSTKIPKKETKQKFTQMWSHCWCSFFYVMLKLLSFGCCVRNISGVVRENIVYGPNMVVCNANRPTSPIPRRVPTPSKGNTMNFTRKGKLILARKYKEIEFSYVVHNVFDKMSLPVIPLFYFNIIIFQDMETIFTLFSCSSIHLDCFIMSDTSSYCITLESLLCKIIELRIAWLLYT